MAKTQIKNYVFKPGIGANDYRYPNAYSLINSNKEFIQKESTAWIQSQVDADAAGFVGYTYNQAKCERDVGYIIDAYLNDLRYGGNEKLYNTIKYYWDQGVAQVDGDRQPEIQTHTWIGNLIQDNILAQVAYSALNTEVSQTLTGTASESTSTFTPTGATYTPTTGVMNVTIGTHTLSVGDEIFIAPGGISFTCTLDGDATEHPYPRASGVPNDTGKDPFYYAPLIITETTSTTITVNVGISSDTSTHTFSSALADSVTSGPATKINTLAFNTVDVITNGLGAQPTLVPVGVGTIKIQGRYSIDELLLISNSTRSEVLYNFTNVNTGASIEIKDTIDEDFLKFKETTDGVSTIKLNYDTSDHLSTDDIQVFVEEKEVRTRPFDFGTDAIERPRAAMPVSMLDADFEYGLQPTKWSAIGTMRGYPSVYEIPGTDTDVVRVVTDSSLSEPVRVFTADVTSSGTDHWVWSNAQDRNGNVTGNDPNITLIEGDTLTVTNNANSSHPFYFKTVQGTGTANPVSNVTNNGGHTGEEIKWVTQPGDAGTYFYQCSSHANMVGTITVLANDQGSGVGQSLITVSTVAAHGFEAGTPISIKALENSIAGASRAEGTFIIVQVPSNTTFQYFAKAKVGSTVGEVLSTGYTQLREAGFYTGASIGQPEFAIASNGSSGTMFAQLGVLSGEVVIPFDGTAPELGSPLSQSGIPVGSQVTSIIDQSEGGGTFVTPLSNSNIPAGQNQITVQDITGVVENLAVDRGDGNAIYITSVDGNTITFNGNFTREIVGNRNEYTGVEPDNDTGVGSGAKFDISHSGDSSLTYVIDAIENDGINYKVGDRITILGTQLGGATPANDAVIVVDEVGSANSIALASINGLHFDNDILLEGQTATFTGGNGTGAGFDISFQDGIFSSVDVTAAQTGADYAIGDVLTASADVLVAGYSGPERILYISVDEVETTGGQTTSVQLQDGGTGYTSGTTVATTGGSGTGLTLSITEGGDGIITDVTIVDAGSGYAEFDIVTLSTGNGDATVRIDSVKSIGAINTVTFAGSAPEVDKTFTGVAYTTTSASGSAAVIDVQVTGDSYTVTFTNSGINFVPTETITVAGDQLGGATPANDLTITIDNVDANGTITSFTAVGVTFNGDTLTGIPGTNRVPIDATFDVTQNPEGVFNATLVAPGEGYNVGQIHTISGTVFGGTTPENDLSITITSITDLQAGEIQTITASGTGYIPVGVYIDVVGTNNPSLGTGAEFTIIRNSGNYSSISITNPGSGYEPGNRLEVEASVVDGVSPLNDILINVTTVDETGGISAFTTSSEEAAVGESIDLISTVTMSEATSAPIVSGAPITFSAVATIEAEFETAHGLVPGDTFITSIDSDNGTNNHELAAGSYIATEIPSTLTLRFQARTVGSIDVDNNNDPILGSVYPRPDSFFIHRPFDGGVQLGTGGPQHGAQAIRQSKKYIRYQSGKGIMYTTGALFAPSYDIRSVVADGVEVGSEITITTDDNDHGVQVGGIVRLLGVETPGYNSGPQTAVPPQFDYEVVEVVNERTFKVLSQRRLGATTAVLGFAAQMSVVKWHGATVRSGIFDDQNGIFWEYDGTQINVVQRTGTYQVAGTIAIDVDKNAVTGTDTRFRDQLKAGDRIIIRGMTHVVSHVIDQTNMTVTPDFRGVSNVTGAKAMLVFDKRTKQADFNLDRLDGTGPSGYDIDIAKMQMIGIQYSWYGAGFIDFMLRGADGNFVFAHRMRNSNVNTEAFMRSGNLPVRYEVTNEGPNAKLAADMNSTQVTVPLDSENGKFFPTSGTVYIDNEIINFTGRTGNTLTGCTRSAVFTNFQGGSVRSYTAGDASAHSSNTGVVLISQTTTPLISHWGSAFITDGGFDEDRGYIFSYAETGVTISTTKQTAFMIRLSPSVSNAIVGDLGERELLNRAQLLLQGLEITSASGAASEGGIIVEGVLNPQNFPIDPGSVSWQGLSGVAQGGQPSFAQIAPGGGTQWSSGDAATTATATAQANIEATADVRYNRSNTSFVDVRQASFESTGAQVGDFVSGTSGSANSSFSTPKQITFINGPWGRGDRNSRYYRLYFNSNYSGTVSGTVTLQRQTSLTNSSFAYLDVNTFLASNAIPGTAVTQSGGSVTFPASTLISSVALEEFGNSEYYKVSFNQTFSGTLVQNTGTVEFEFVQPPFAQPGETVFSFIATPGERSTLDLSALKELTNTPLGGRGTFPNGPDVLAINVYKISGADIDGNLILKWGEAQA